MHIAILKITSASEPYILLMKIPRDTRDTWDTQIKTLSFYGCIRRANTKWRVHYDYFLANTLHWIKIISWFVIRQSSEQCSSKLEEDHGVQRSVFYLANDHNSFIHIISISMHARGDDRNRISQGNAFQEKDVYADHRDDVSLWNNLLFCHLRVHSY